MTTIEEQIWDYIDGNGDVAQRLEMERRIANDETYAAMYRELTAIRRHLLNISFDEPSMSFSRNVMDLVNMEAPPVSLKTKTDKRIILGISAFFILTITSIFVYVISQSHFTTPKVTIAMEFDSYLNPTFIKIFLFIDIIIGFLYADRLFRRNWMS
jgi:hypothetical protein